MPLVRMLVSWNLSDLEPKDAITNTLYFNVSGSIDPPNYQSLVDDLYAIYAAKTFCAGQILEVRAYDMADPEPRPIKASKRGTVTGSAPTVARQVALCLSYYVDRNLPGYRGRIFCGPFSQSTIRATVPQQQTLIDLGNALAGLGGLNVDWSLYSPKRGEADRISNIWVDNSWDIQRSRKVKGTSRLQATING